MRALIIAWVITLGILGSGAVWLQYSYDQQNQPLAPDPRALAGDETTADEEQSGETAGPADDEQIRVAETSAEADTPEQETSTLPSRRDPEAIEPEPPFDDSSLEDDGAEDPASKNNGGGNSSATASLTEEGPYGPMPVIRAQRMPWIAYGQPFMSGSSRPRIAIVITGLGMKRDITETAIRSMPPGVTFAFSPYGSDLQSYASASFSNGHEMLMMLPMEPRDYPANDPGPHTLLTNLDSATNLDRLYWVLSRFLGYVGIISEMGSEFTASAEDVGPIMQDLQRRGLLFVDSRSTQFTVAASAASDLGMPYAINDRFIDNSLNAVDITTHLQNLENVARATGVAVGVGQAIPVTMNAVIEWAASLAGKGIDLVPITAVAGRQTVN